MNFSRIVCLLLLSTIVACKTEVNINISRNSNDTRCSKNADKRYKREIVLPQMAEALNNSIPEYKNRFHQSSFSVVNNDPRGFFIYDLSDTTNKIMESGHCIKLIDQHIYHFSPFRYPYDLSHIAYLHDGEVKIFGPVDCTNRGSRLQEVLHYLQKNLADNSNKDILLERVREHRKYGIYYKIDPMAQSLCK